MYSVAGGSTGLLLLVVTIAHQGQSQVQAGVAVGDRIRYWYADKDGLRRVSGTLLRLTNDTFAFRLAHDSIVRVPRTQVARLDVSTGRYRSGALGAAFGLGGGVLAGSIGGALSRFRDGICRCVDAGKNMRRGAFLGGVVGLVGGAAVGMPREGWKTVTIPEIGGKPIVARGPRVRLRYTIAAETTTAIGFLHAADSTSVVLRDAPSRGLIDVPRYAIRASELSLGSRRHKGDGFVLGLLGGAGLGAGISALAQGPKPRSGDSYRDLNIVVAGLVGALGGAVAGAIIGSQISTETWEPYQLPARRDPP